jgi:hypothetical protein
MIQLTISRAQALPGAVEVAAVVPGMLPRRRSPNHPDRFASLAAAERAEAAAEAPRG